MLWSIQNSVKYEKPSIKLEIITYERWVKKQQETPSPREKPAADCAGTKRFCGCCNLADIINGEKAWEIAQKGLTDFDFHDSKNE